MRTPIRYLKLTTSKPTREQEKERNREKERIGYQASIGEHQLKGLELAALLLEFAGGHLGVNESTCTRSAQELLDARRTHFVYKNV